MLRSALHMIVLGAALGFGAFLGIAVAWRWPINFASAAAIGFVCYCAGRIRRAELANQPAVTITSLPTARTRRRRHG